VAGPSRTLTIGVRALVCCVVCLFVILSIWGSLSGLWAPYMVSPDLIFPVLVLFDADTALFLVLSSLFCPCLVFLVLSSLSCLVLVLLFGE